MRILGLSYDTDAAAALCVDGRLVAAVAEERFTRVKHDRSFPDAALRFCLDEGGVALEEVEWAALGWNPAVHLEPLLWRRSSRVRHHSEYLSAVPNLLIQARSQRPSALLTEQVLHFHEGPPLRVAYVDHHLSHAAWALASPFERCAVLTVDGFGEATTTTLGTCTGTTLETSLRVRRPHSLGSLYAAVTQHLGLRPNRDEGQVMSLAAMGDPGRAASLRELIRLDEDGSFELDLSYFGFYTESTSRVSPKFVTRFGPPRREDDPIEDRHRDLAAAVQGVFEEAYLHLARTLERRTGLRDLVIAGGAALNCVANGRVLAETGFERLFGPPATGDDGAAAGAALYLHCVHLGLPRAEAPLRSAALGPACSDDDVAGLLALAGRTATALTEEEVPRVAAELLAAGSDFVLGWYQGRAEFGPRALGNRSILADPRSPTVKDRLNAQVKFRSAFRPFCPVVLAERCDELFEAFGPSPFMLQALRVRADWAPRIPAVLHTDGTARVQTVATDEVPPLRALLERFEALTGVPALLNTSLNTRGEPIVNDPTQALACFDGTGMDFLFLGRHLLAKPSQACQAALDAALGSARGPGHPGIRGTL